MINYLLENVTEEKIVGIVILGQTYGVVGVVFLNLTFIFIVFITIIIFVKIMENI